MIKNSAPVVLLRMFQSRKTCSLSYIYLLMAMKPMIKCMHYVIMQLTKSTFFRNISRLGVEGIPDTIQIFQLITVNVR